MLPMEIIEMVFKPIYGKKTDEFIKKNKEKFESLDKILVCSKCGTIVLSSEEAQDCEDCKIPLLNLTSEILGENEKTQNQL